MSEHADERPATVADLAHRYGHLPADVLAEVGRRHFESLNLPADRLDPKDDTR